MGVGEREGERGEGGVRIWSDEVKRKEIKILNEVGGGAVALNRGRCC